MLLNYTDFKNRYIASLFIEKHVFPPPHGIKLHLGDSEVHKFIKKHSLKIDGTTIVL